MRDQIAVLRELCRLDEQVQTLKGRIRNREMELNRNVAEETLMRELFEREKENLSTIEKNHRETDGEIAVIRERKLQLNKNLNVVKGNTEYTALLREIASIDQKISDLEDMSLQLMDDEEIGKEKIGKLKKNVNEKRKGLETIRVSLTSEKEKLSLEIADLTGQWEKQVSTLKAGVRSKYERLLAAKGDTAIVSVEENACGGCHFRLPPQVVAEVRGADRMVYCESCGRILVLATEKNQV